MKTFAFLPFIAAALISCTASEAGKNESPDSFAPDPADSIIKNSHTYCFLEKFEDKNCLVNRIGAPGGYQRTALPENSFGAWLRFIPLREGKPMVYLYNGTLKLNQEAHYAVIDIDAGKSDLQQCADAVMRLRAEYLYAGKRFSDIHFNYTSGDNIPFTKWSKGFRPVVSGNKVSWTKSAAADSSYKSFRAYMSNIFMYAGTLSLAKEMKTVTDLNEITAADVFIVGGSPGHAVTVMDVAQNSSGDKIFLLSQSYMPAQDVHILVNPNDPSLSPWYSVKDIGEELLTPEWTFSKTQLKRF